MRNFTKMKFWLLLMVMGVLSSATVLAQPKLTITPDPLNLGEWPIGGWQESAFLTLANAETGVATLTSSDLDDADGVFAISALDLPMELTQLSGDAMVGVSFIGDGVTAGVYTATYVATWNASKSVTTADVLVTAYEAVEGDIIENPFVVALPHANVGVSTALPMRSNYVTPGTATNGKDVVYKFTLTEDQEIDITIANATETAKIALYAADFGGEAGPMVSNAIAIGGTSIASADLFAGDYFVVVGCEAADAAMTFDITIAGTTMPDPEKAFNPTPADGAIEIASNGLSLTWEFGQYTNEYKLSFGTTYPPSEVLVDWTSDLANTFALPNLDPSMQYFWKVDVKNNNGTIEGDVWGFTTTLTPPASLTALVVENAMDEYDVVLNWDASAKGLLSYNIYRDGANIGTTAAGINTYTDEDVAYNMDPCYEYQVEAIFDEGVSEMSNTASACITGVGTINGVVTALLTGNPIEGALVEVDNGTWSTSTTTDMVGNYSIVVYEGTYDYTVSADDYITENLDDVDVAYGATVANDFELDEFPYPVADVIATELNDNTVQVDWSGTGGGNIAEWLFYDDGVNVDAIGGPATFTWAIKFDADQLTEVEGASVTKFQFYVSQPETVHFMVMQGDDASVIYTEDFSGLTVDAWNEVELTTPVAFDNTQALWFGINTTAGDVYPASCGDATGEPNGDLITLDGTTWDHLSGYGLNFTWNLRGFVTDANGKSYSFAKNNTSAPDYAKVPTANFAVANNTPSANASLPKTAQMNAKDVMGYNVYRQVCNGEAPMEFLGMTLDQQFTDNTWGATTWGTYKWAVETIYTNNVSDVTYSNCLDKDMVATVDVSVTTTSGDAPEGCAVLFTNISEPDLGLTYPLTLDATGLATIEDFRKGTYNIDVTLNGYTAINEVNVLVDEDKSFAWILEELLLPPTDLYVTPTGFATWGGGGSMPFEALFENFDEGIPETWEVIVGGNSADTWTATAGPGIDGTPYVRADADAAGSGVTMDELLISPIVDASMVAELFIEWDQNYQNFAGEDHFAVEVYDGSAWVEVFYQDTDDAAWPTLVHNSVDVTEFANADFRVRFHYVAPGWDWYIGIDNVSVNDGSDKYADNKAFQFYKVWHSGTFSTDRDTNFYQYGENETLVAGETYLAEVASLYSTGLSAKAEYEWTYVPCEEFPGWLVSDAYNVEESDDNLVVWTDAEAAAGDDYEEGFEAGTLPTGWTMLDEDGDGYGWDNSAVEDFGFEAHTGDYCMTSASYRNDVGALTPDNWLIAPAIYIGPESELSFWISAQDAAWSDEHYYVKVSTTGTAVGDFTTTIHDAITTGTWEEIVIDLSAFAGETVHIAIQHADVTDMFWIKMDDFKVTGTPDKAAYTAPVKPGTSAFMPIKTKGLSQEQIDAKLAIAKADKAAKALEVLGANITRNGEFLAYVALPDTFYLDSDLEAGMYTYCITKVYTADGGLHTWTSCEGTDCYDVEITEDCAPPTNLTAEDLLGDGFTATLNWEGPSGGGGSFDPQWLSYGADVNVDGIGGPAEFSYATKWDAAQLTEFDGGSVTQVKFFPREAGTSFTLKIWKGSDASTLIYEQPLSGLTFEDWNTITLDTPVELDVTDELWVGFYVVTSGYPAGCDNYVGSPNTDLITLDGVVWEHLAGYGLNYSWNLEAYVDNAKGETTALTVVDHATYSGNGTLAAGNLPTSPNAVDATAGAKEFLGYNVYRDGDQINEEIVLETTYLDVLDASVYHCYEVTAIYSYCGESNVSNEACVQPGVGVEEMDNSVVVYPNPANDFVTVKASSNIRTIEITNYMGQVVNSIKAVEYTQHTINTTDLSAGIYFVEVETTVGIEKVRIVISK